MGIIGDSILILKHCVSGALPLSLTFIVLPVYVDVLFSCLCDLFLSLLYNTLLSCFFNSLFSSFFGNLLHSLFIISLLLLLWQLILSPFISLYIRSRKLPSDLLLQYWIKLLRRFHLLIESFSLQLVVDDIILQLIHLLRLLWHILHMLQVLIGVESGSCDDSLQILVDFLVFFRFDEVQVYLLLIQP